MTLFQFPPFEAHHDINHDASTALNIEKLTDGGPRSALDVKCSWKTRFLVLGASFSCYFVNQEGGFPCLAPLTRVEELVP